VIPKGLIAFLVMLATGFGISMGGSMRKKALEPKYQPLANAGTINFSTQTHPTAASYQNPASDVYAISNKQKEFTYCVIDGRLVDQ